jgi:hypothetical protein
LKSKGKIREEFKRNATCMGYINDRSVYDLHYNKIHKESLDTLYSLKLFIILRYITGCYSLEGNSTLSKAYLAR